VFHAKHLQAKCASKYAPKPVPVSRAPNPAAQPSNMTAAPTSSGAGI